MGNRAAVVFEDEKSRRFSPAVYLHWNGGPESVYAFLDELDRRKVRADQDYEAARFVQIVGDFFDTDKYICGLSLGVSNSWSRITDAALARVCPGDNGIYLVCRAVSPRRIRRFFVGGELSPEEVGAEYREALGKPDWTGGDGTYHDAILGVLSELTAGKEIRAF